MSPKNQRKTSKRGANHLDTNTSPTQVKPPKKQKSKMSESATKEIMEMLKNINAQNEGLKLQLDAQQKEMKENASQLSKEIEDSRNMLKTEMTQLVDNMRLEFKAEIDNMNNKIDTSATATADNMNVMNEKFNGLDSKIKFIENDFERISHLNELKLIGIPTIANENLADTFTKLANVIGYDTTNPSNIPATTRMITRNKITNEMALAPTIILKFAANHMKEAFYSLYLRLLPKKKLSAKDLGFTVENRIIIGENLSQHNHELFIAASNMKRDKKLSQVFTVNGIVNVKMQKGGKTHEIRHKQQLETLTSTIACTSNALNNSNNNNTNNNTNTTNEANTTAATPNQQPIESSVTNTDAIAAASSNNNNTQNNTQQQEINVDNAPLNQTSNTSPMDHN